MSQPESKIVAITVRMPESVKDRIYELSNKERRSINSEIIHLLESSLNAQALSTPAKAGRPKKAASKEG
ncbi:MAG: Arc family DNA-binding protein [Deltaproteobacteria bacterium]|nr:Arc family DNA-binding protein [Deltaproteobacteria bacterium]